MLLIRRFEEKVEERFRAGELPGFLHVAIGQEAVAVGVCRALEEGDIIASTHRAHGHTLAKGTTPNELMAELYGKLEGCSHGYGGSMHLYDVERGNLGANAVVGGGLPATVGAALAFKFRDEPRVAVAFFGDGATNIGTFHESLNLGQLWQVPAVFVCENNHWAESTPARQHLPIEDLSKRAVAYGMEAIRADGQDVEEVYRAALASLDHAREGRGPVFLLLETYRLTGHYIGDPQVYRPKDEVKELRETQDPITKLRERLELSDEEFEDADREAVELVEASDEFGADRVRNTPISEMALVGAGVGAAMQGMRPVVEVMYEDFLTLSAEQIVNQAAKHRYMSGGQVKVPLTIRTQGGAGWSPGAQHAQQLEAWFVHIPGLKVVFPSTPTDVRGLLWSSIYDDNPVLFFEHRTLYGIKEEVPEELEPIPLGTARVHREGGDVTVIATCRLVHEALRAAEQAEGDGISVEVVDPRTLQPLDETALVDSVKKTNRCVVAHEAITRMGFGAEITALLQEQTFDWLDAPIERVGAKFVPLPFAPVMEEFVVPHSDDVLQAILRTVGK